MNDRVGSNPENKEAPRPKILVGALLHLMSAHRRNQCPRLALVIARHLECLARHPDASTIVRQISLGVCGEWRDASDGSSHPATPIARPRLN